jgi:type II secretory ATPase GspE/PulE/Tfp pilus assembly ATPase PilB-like protein
LLQHTYLFTRAISSVALVISLLTVAVPGDTILLHNGNVIENVEISQQYPNGTIEFEVNGVLQTFGAERYKLITDKDLIVLKDGSHQVGQILENDGQKVRFESEAGSVSEFQRADYTRLVSGSGTVADPVQGGSEVMLGATQAAIRNARDAVQRGNYKRALDEMEEAGKLGLSDLTIQYDVRDEAYAAIGEITNFVVQEYNRLMGQSLAIPAADLAKEVGEALGSPDLEGAYPRLQQQLEVVEYFETLESNALIQHGGFILQRENRGRYPDALKQFERANVIRPSFWAMIGIAEIHVRMDDLQKSETHLTRAKLALDAVNQTDPAYSTMNEQYNKVMSQYRSLQDKFGKTPEDQANATPTPSPTPRRNAQPELLTPIPTPTRTPKPPEGAAKYLDQFVKKPYEQFNEFTEKNVGLQGWQSIVAVILAWLIFYTLPNFSIRKLVNKGNLTAANWQSKVKKFGLIALILMMLSLLFDKFNLPRLPGMGKKKPAEKPLEENIDELPVYDLEDHIQRLLRNLESGSMQSLGPSSGGALEKDGMQRLVRAIVTLGIKRRASDVHIETEMDGANVRMRLDGVLYDMISVPRSLSNALISAIKVMANMDIAQKRQAQDGKISLWVDNSDVDIRINTAPSPLGERVTMRLLDSRAIQVDSNKLGLEGRNLQVYDQIIRRPSGVIFITGPTGSGKTTTLYVSLNSLNNGEKNILTIEDPIEYQMKGINQMQVNEQAGFAFADGLKSILRSDPDIIMVGEIRDKETADIAIDAASTGHLVFTTVHTIDAPTVLTRLLDLGVEPRRAAHSMLAAVAQRLIRVNCPSCKEPYSPSPVDLTQLNVDEETISQTTFYKGAGCEECHQTGFQGRIGLFEIMMPDEKLRDMMESGASINVVREAAKKQGMTTLREEGVQRIMQGITTVEEVLRAT